MWSTGRLMILHDLLLVGGFLYYTPFFLFIVSSIVAAG